ncbi:HlyD family efflux transporter periplasmic adaptor subunit [Rosistilla oblonga]|uniref:Multidrug resistance protein MdtN n=1 Tax=Rosistilla oblonga TaxID=2527990 RepID=A0A518IWX4_9BACT|nr:HlyD family efflux transporter periplasmic adaptor subunit [Rosistilla oblonga]QDV57588.1 multidrug resistance protein MdtN [Rosistilla oblonga]
MSAPTNIDTPTSTPHQSADTFVLGHLARLVTSLTAQGTTSAAVYRQLFATIVEHYKPLVAKIDVRDQAARYNDAHQSQRLSGTMLIEVGSIAVAETLTDAICEEAPVFRINSLDATKKYVTIGVPIRDPLQRETTGGLAVALVPRNQSDINALVAELNSLTLAAAGCIDSQPTEQKTHSNADWARVLSRVAKMGDRHEFAITLVNTLADRFVCGKAGLGLIRGKRVEVRAISGLSTLKQNSPGVADMRQVMEECFDQKTPVFAGRHNEHEQRSLPIHRGWSEQTHSAILSVPIMLENEVLAVVTLSRAADKPFLDEDLESLTKLLEPFGPSLQLIEKSSRSIAEHVREEGRGAVMPWLKPQSHARKAAMITAGLFFAWFLFGSLTYRPMCESALSPASILHMAAPIDSRIEQVLVSSGDRVTKDQVLVVLDSRELQLQRNQLLAQIASTEVAVGQAIADRKVGEAALAKADVRVLHSQLDSIENQIEQSVLRAPADGIVVAADLKKRIGEVLPQGEPLVTFAPGERWVVEIMVPDHVAPYVAQDQTGVFRAYSHPDQSIPFKIDWVGGAAQVVEGKNVFIAEAELQSQTDWMKAGMKGVGRIQAQRKAVWWVTMHGLVDYLHMKFWL